MLGTVPQVLARRASIAVNAEMASSPACAIALLGSGSKRWVPEKREDHMASLLRTRLALTVCCAAVLAATQATPAYAASRTVHFDYTHLWLTPEFETAGGPIHFTVKACDRPTKDMTVLLRRTDGFNYDVGTETIKCRANQRATFDVGRNPAGTYEFELGKLDDGTRFKGTATYSFTGPK
ncbi:hypothetical protein AB0L14_28315 [Streptomyces sp. NPDC052727]|uniref:hypothetical protein n=1 Tax=Streptomyces sp. NPDC052727 TaxID=3154854 RepID=UPI00341ED4C8